MIDYIFSVEWSVSFTIPYLRLLSFCKYLSFLTFVKSSTVRPFSFAAGSGLELLFVHTALYMRDAACMRRIFSGFGLAPTCVSSRPYGLMSDVPSDDVFEVEMPDLEASLAFAK